MDENLLTVSQYPLPPAHFQLYSDYNEDEPSSPDCPLPPKPPIGQFRCFGQTYMVDDVPPALEEPVLFNTNPDADMRIELKNLNQMLLKKYIKAIDSLLEDPSSGLETLKDMENILRNMYFIINSFRRHQARKCILRAMEEQLHRRQAEIKSLRDRREQATNLIAQTKGLFLQTVGVPDPKL
eukprot:Rmarinus@m.7166